MEYALSALLLVLNLFRYHYEMDKTVFFLVGAVIFVSLFLLLMKKTENFLAVCIMMFCYTWSISWVNIFGTPTSQLQLPWFYIIGIMVVIYAFVNVKEILKREYNAVLMSGFIVFFIIFNLPLLYSASFKEGIKEYIMIGFFAVIVFIAFLFHGSIPQKLYSYIKKAFVWSIFIVSLGIILQWIAFNMYGIQLFKIGNWMSYSGYQTSCYLLLEDASCSSLMIGCAVFYIFDMISKKNVWYMAPALAINLAALAMTSRRTSVVSLIIVLAIYFLVHYRGIGKKIAMIGVFAACTAILIYYILQSRPMDSLAQLFDENGRVTTYLGALNILLKNPFGVGYDNVYLSSIMSNGIVAHNTILRWLNMGGYIFTAVLLFLIIWTIVESYKKRLTIEFWVIFYAMFASNLIPDILNARFFVIPCALVFLLESGDRKETSVKLL